MGTRIATVVVQSQAAAMLAWPRALLLDRPGVTLKSSSFFGAQRDRPSPIVVPLRPTYGQQP